jgi:hypothetical protein
MTELDRPQLKKTIVEFATRGVQKFLQEHPGLVFYAFAFDCNAEYAEINLCLNTENDFSKSLLYYQAKNSKNYQSEEDIRDLKFNTGDWEYQCFDTLYVLTEKQLNMILQTMPEDDYQTWQTFAQDLILLFTEALNEFSQTGVYKDIPKTADFVAFCIDHDEDLEDAWGRMKLYG